VFSRASFDKMSKGDQELVRKFGREAQAEQRKLWQEREAASMAELKKQGIEIITFEPAEKAKFQAAVKPVWDKHGAKYTALVQRIQDVK
jgi:TRAP-type C4-dicarboxylate transport system substrate-binding protein